MLSITLLLMNILLYLLLTEDEGTVNYLDNLNGHVDPTKTDGSVIKYYQSAGIRMTHIDARGVKYVSGSKNILNLLKILIQWFRPSLPIVHP